jgi:Glycosyltransferase family 87
MTPLSALPERHAVTLYMPLSIAAILLAIRLLGVRDWRCYVLVLFFPFVYESLRHGALGSLLLLLLALSLALPRPCGRGRCSPRL